LRLQKMMRVLDVARCGSGRRSVSALVGDRRQRHRTLRDHGLAAVDAGAALRCVPWVREEGSARRVISGGMVAEKNSVWRMRRQSA
jgi:hypothetical protein